MAKPSKKRQIEVRTEAIQLGVAWLRDSPFGGRTLVVGGLCYPLDHGQHCANAHNHMLRAIATASLERGDYRPVIAATPDLGVML